jgi:hypothetical protein
MTGSAALRAVVTLLWACGWSTAGVRAEATTAERPPSPSPVIPVHGLVVSEPRGDLIVVLGAEGTPEFGALFGEWSSAWEGAAERGGLKFHLIGDLVGDASTTAVKDQLRVQLKTAEAETTLPLWIVLIGHGTFDGRTAKFNLLGEDISADEFATWLAGVSRPTAVLQCASASGAFLEELSLPGRVIVAATKSGQEGNFARFGGYLALAAADPAADLDKDQQVSLLEAYLRAARRTEEFYAGENRLATEHPLLDDNGDGRGVRAAAFAGVRPVRQSDSGATLDGYAAHQWILIPNAAEAELSPEVRARRDELELAVMQLRERKGQMTEDAYFTELERLLVELARVSLGKTSASR